MTDKRVALIFPAYNEALTIAGTIEGFAKVAPAAEFVVIDNRSSDETGSLARSMLQKHSLRGRVLFEGRPGKGNAVRRAFNEVDADIYVMCDADNTYLPEDLPKLLEPVFKGEAEVVVGNRHANRVYQEQNSRLFHDFGNQFVRWLINRLFGTGLSDILSGYRVMSYRFVKNFPALSEGFELETELTLHAVDKRFAQKELPIGYRSRPEGSESKLNTWRDGFRVMKTVLWVFKDYRPLVFFTIVSALCFFSGFAVGFPVILEFMSTGLVPKFPSAILASGLMILSANFFATGLVLDTVVKNHRAEFELRIRRYFPGMFLKG